MTQDKALTDKKLLELQHSLGPIGMFHLMRLIASDESNNFRIADEFKISLFTVNLLRLRRGHCMEYVLDLLAEELAKSSPLWSERIHLTTKQNLSMLG